jgi:lipopolysaccharide/colanic/teichoic acid biosynthesis glycosyltransferase
VRGDAGVAAAVSDTSIAVDVHRSALWAEVDAAAKRVLDVVVGAVGLLLLAPVLALLALLIRLDSPGPVFYRAARAGYRGRDLAMLKFRKMRDGAAGIPLTLADDDRFTRLGRWLARRKIDELPQLWHLITGEMSLVGPRPEAAGFVALQREEYEQILAVRPGIFGWSQLAFAKEGQVLDTSDPVAHYVSTILPQKMSLDAMYARQRTLLIDLRIVFWSVRTVLAGTSVAVHRTDGAMRVRTRPDQAHPAGSAHRNAACVKESSRAAGPGPHVGGRCVVARGLARVVGRCAGAARGTAGGAGAGAAGRSLA